MGVHDGHRERLKARYLEHGLDNFNDINALELLLFYAIPRCDTNTIAHELLDRFGSLSAVLEANIEELQEVSGIGANASLLLSLIPQVSRRYLMDKRKPLKRIDSAAAAGAYFLPLFTYERDEILYMLCLDSKKCIICCITIARGVVNSVEANVRKMTELALRNKAASVIISHNHPRGSVKPSREDDFVTENLARALRAVGIELDDHIIVCGDSFSSYKESGMFLTSLR